jgi:hypothetical protein
VASVVRESRNLDWYNKVETEEETKRAMSELKKVIGAVEVITTDKNGYYKIQVGGTMYSTGSKTAPEVAVGQTVEFTPEARPWKDKTFYNVARDTLKVVTAKASTQPSAAPVAQAGAARNFGTAADKENYWANKEARDLANEAKREITQLQIQQQAARNAAIEFVKILADEKALPYGKVPAGATDVPAKKKLEVIEATVDHYTTKFLSEVQSVGVVEESGEATEVASDDSRGEDE